MTLCLCLSPDHGTDKTKDCYGVKMVAYLEPLNASNGCLRLVPGSHLEPLHTELRALTGLGEKLPSYACVSQPGDIVAFNMRCYHSAWGGGPNRRMCTLVYPLRTIMVY